MIESEQLNDTQRNYKRNKRKLSQPPRPVEDPRVQRMVRRERKTRLIEVREQEMYS